MSQEIIDTAKRLGVSVPMVDTRPIPSSVRRSARLTQADCFAEWLRAHGHPSAAATREALVVVGGRPHEVESLREALLSEGTAGLLALVR